MFKQQGLRHTLVVDKCKKMLNNLLKVLLSC